MCVGVCVCIVWKAMYQRDFVAINACIRDLAISPGVDVPNPGFPGNFSENFFDFCYPVKYPRNDRNFWNSGMKIWVKKSGAIIWS